MPSWIIRAHDPARVNDDVSLKFQWNIAIFRWNQMHFQTRTFFKAKFSRKLDYAHTKMIFIWAESRPFIRISKKAITARRSLFANVILYIRKSDIRQFITWRELYSFAKAPNGSPDFVNWIRKVFRFQWTKVAVESFDCVSEDSKWKLSIRGWCWWGMVWRRMDAL